MSARMQTRPVQRHTVGVGIFQVAARLLVVIFATFAVLFALKGMDQVIALIGSLTTLVLTALVLFWDEFFPARRGRMTEAFMGMIAFCTDPDTVRLLLVTGAAVIGFVVMNKGIHAMFDPFDVVYAARIADVFGLIAALVAAGTTYVVSQPRHRTTKKKVVRR